MKTKRILFITGTRADYGKMKPLMQAMDKDPQFDTHIFVCGMHLAETFGRTYEEVLKDQYHNTYVAYGLCQTTSASVNLGNTITHLAGYVENIRPDMIVVHGDRMDALAGAVVGALHNIIVAHIEGGELSGTIDESIRHAISKFAHIHFVCTDEAKTRLLQLGEEDSRIHVIGSPDIDIMMRNDLPTLDQARERYDIPFTDYGILIYHPVTTEQELIRSHIKEVVDGVLASGKNYVVVFPNNDLGSDAILNEYQRLKGNAHFRVFPSLRFEHFLTLLKHAAFMIGNSSAGIRESGIYGVPSIDIGTRQNNRYTPASCKNVQHIAEEKDAILDAIGKVEQFRTATFLFGRGDSTEKFLTRVKEPAFWEVDIQKRFIDFMM